MAEKRKAYSTPEAQAEADKRWAERNREHKNYLSRRSNARGFIKNLATTEDLKDLKERIERKFKKM